MLPCSIMRTIYMCAVCRVTSVFLIIMFVPVPLSIMVKLVISTALEQALSIYVIQLTHSVDTSMALPS